MNLLYQQKYILLRKKQILLLDYAFNSTHSTTLRYFQYSNSQIGV